MKKSIELFLKKLTILFVIAGISVVAISCGGDDGYDCNAGEDKLSDLYDDYYDAEADGDCDDMEDISEEIIAELKKAKGCAELKELIDDLDYDDFDEFLEEEVEEEFEYYSDYWGC